MSDFKDFLNSRILRHPTTWIAAAAGGVYGGLDMYWIREAKRAAGAQLQYPSLWLERTVDFLAGAAFQIVFLLIAVYMLAGLMEKSNVWLRQITVLAVYLGLNWLGRFV